MLTMIVVPNTSPEQIVANIMHNAALDRNWLRFQEETIRQAIMVGGGPSAADHLDDIRKQAEEGGIIYACNAASSWLRKNGVEPDFQVIADAKEESSELVDTLCKSHLFSSAVNPKTMLSARYPVVWHPLLDGIEECFPDGKKSKEYALIGGTSAGTHAMCIAYVLGHREFHCYGYDSSHRNGESHAYRQPMNDDIPNVNVTWAGKTYYASVAMKAQAEHFQGTARAMKELGCTINVHGDGLLPAMWNTLPQDLSERDKYKLMWQTDIYRKVSPGERAVPLILQYLKPKGRVLDFGCGTGRASIELDKLGHEVMLIDFADNCRDHEALLLPFLEHDLTKPIPQDADFGICCDVMEHIPPDDVLQVLHNIMQAAEKVFFSIGTLPDEHGVIIGQSLHLTVRPHNWWHQALSTVGTVEYEQHLVEQSNFVVKRNPALARH
jgi:SAM-dependent methyltransferase